MAAADDKELSFSETIDGVRNSVWREALERAGGRIAQAAREFGFSRQRGWALTKRHGLVEEARTMRLAHGQPAIGRPRDGAVGTAKRSTK